jgi:protein HOOK3
VGDNWVLKINNLKKLYKLVSRYYEEVLDMSFTNLPEVNLNAIAKDSDPRGIIQLCKYILTIAVMCSDNLKYIQNIQLLSEGSQNHIKKFIEEVTLTTFLYSCKHRNLISYTTDSIICSSAKRTSRNI